MIISVNQRFPKQTMFDQTSQEMVSQNSDVSTRAKLLEFNH